MQSIKNFLILLFYVSPIWEANAQSNAANTQTLIKTDNAFCNEAIHAGFYAAIIKYADDSIIKLNDEELPIVGKAAFAAIYQDAGTKDISWYPVGCKVAESNDLGFTWGNWMYKEPDTVYYGNYVTIWRKQIDGSWKVLLDGGNDTPEPAQKK